MGELRLHLAMTAIEPNKLFTTFVVSRKFPIFLIRRQAQGDACMRLRQLVVIEHVLCERLCPQWQSAYRGVDALLRHAVRASSAVECVNSVVRMHQGRHRHVSQGLLDLKRLY